MAPLLQSATTPADGHAIVTVRGDIDADTALQLWQYLSYLVGQGHQHIVLDLRGQDPDRLGWGPGPGPGVGLDPPQGRGAGAAVGQPGPG